MQIPSLSPFPTTRIPTIAQPPFETSPPLNRSLNLDLEHTGIDSLGIAASLDRKRLGYKAGRQCECNPTFSRARKWIYSHCTIETGLVAWSCHNWNNISL